MSSQEILTKAIEKAITGGWDKPFDDYKVEEGYIYGRLKGGTARIYINDIIFNHDFAKALWGEQELTVESGENIPAYGKRLSLQQRIVAWKYHLQQMVIADDPIKYLGDNI